MVEPGSFGFGRHGPPLAQSKPSRKTNISDTFRGSIGFTSPDIRAASATRVRLASFKPSKRHKVKFNYCTPLCP